MVLPFTQDLQPMGIASEKFQESAAEGYHEWKWKQGRVRLGAVVEAKDHTLPQVLLSAIMSGDGEIVETALLGGICRSALQMASMARRGDTVAICSLGLPTRSTGAAITHALREWLEDADREKKRGKHRMAVGKYGKGHLPMIPRRILYSGFTPRELLGAHWVLSQWRSKIALICKATLLFLVPGLWHRPRPRRGRQSRPQIYWC